jgi:hypothetical protein
VSTRGLESEFVFSLGGRTFSSIGGEREIHTPAREMCICGADLSPKWREKAISVMVQPKFGQRDYAVAKFVVEEQSQEKALLSFETVVYKDHDTAAGVFAGTLKHMGFLKLSKLDLGDMGAMIEVQGSPNKTLKAILFTERNVMGIIMLSSARDYNVPDAWLVSMARLMAGRTK